MSAILIYGIDIHTMKSTYNLLQILTKLHHFVICANVIKLKNCVGKILKNVSGTPNIVYKQFLIPKEATFTPKYRKRKNCAVKIKISILNYVRICLVVI